MDVNDDLLCEDRLTAFLSSVAFPQQIAISSQILQVTFSTCPLRLRPGRHQKFYSNLKVARTASS
jgi:hypothetical protein